jgi:hypothetical protein
MVFFMLTSGLNHSWRPGVSVVSAWSKYHQDAKTRRNTKNLPQSRLSCGYEPGEGILRPLNIGMIFAFLLCAAVQYNDPDPVRWMTI